MKYWEIIFSPPFFKNFHASFQSIFFPYFCLVSGQCAIILFFKWCIIHQWNIPEEFQLCRPWIALISAALRTCILYCFYVNDWLMVDQSKILFEKRYNVIGCNCVIPFFVWYIYFVVRSQKIGKVNWKEWKSSSIKFQNVKPCELSLQQLFIGILQIQRLCHNLFIMLYMIIRNFVNIKLSDILLFQTIFRYLSPLILWMVEVCIFFSLYLWSKYYKRSIEIALRSEFSFYWSHWFASW